MFLQLLELQKHLVFDLGYQWQKYAYPFFREGNPGIAQALLYAAGREWSQAEKKQAYLLEQYGLYLDAPELIGGQYVAGATLKSGLGHVLKDAGMGSFLGRTGATLFLGFKNGDAYPDDSVPAAAARFGEAVTATAHYKHGLTRHERQEIKGEYGKTDAAYLAHDLVQRGVISEDVAKAAIEAMEKTRARRGRGDHVSAPGHYTSGYYRNPHEIG